VYVYVSECVFEFTLACLCVCVDMCVCEYVYIYVRMCIGFPHIYVSMYLGFRFLAPCALTSKIFFPPLTPPPQGRAGGVDQKPGGLIRITA